MHDATVTAYTHKRTKRLITPIETHHTRRNEAGTNIFKVATVMAN